MTGIFSGFIRVNPSILKNPGSDSKAEGYAKQTVKEIGKMQNIFLVKAKENLKMAQVSFAHECYNSCANRAYYAAFQAAVAALADKGYKKGKFDHKWVQAEFSGKLIKRQKVYPGKLKSYLMEMQLLRNTADYECEPVNRKDASDQLRKAAELAGYIRKEMEK
ncbi:MAG: HEPN domain-containing protein [Desulfobacterales bacterium]